MQSSHFLPLSKKLVFDENLNKNKKYLSSKFFLPQDTWLLRKLKIPILDLYIFFTYFTLLNFSPSESLNSISITNSICQGFNSVISDLWAHSTKTRESTRIVVVTLDEYKTLINSKINMCSENLDYYLHYYGSRHRSKNLWNRSTML